MKAPRFNVKTALVLGIALAVLGAACGEAATSTPGPVPPSPASEPTATPPILISPTPEPEVETIDNRPPIADFTFNPLSIPKLDSFETEVTFKATASDPDLDSLTYEWAFTKGRPDSVMGAEVTVAFAGLTPPVVTLTVSDGRGGIVRITKVVNLSLGVHYGPF
ncbi:MAG: hypothetical protein IIB11_06105 [Chloroflexi bacterium]|nr:hypothetical protein [Chloroflexota bacterium]